MSSIQSAGQAERTVISTSQRDYPVVCQAFSRPVRSHVSENQLERAIILTNQYSIYRQFCQGNWAVFWLSVAK